MPVSGIGVTPGAGAQVGVRSITGGTVYAQTVDSAPWPETPCGGTITVVVGTVAMSTGTGFTFSGTATHIYLSVEPDGNAVRFWNTGHTPTATSGHYLAAGAGPIEIGNAQSFRVIAAGTVGGTIQISQHTYT